MDKFFALLMLLSTMVLIIGLIKPEFVLRWGKKSRGRVLLYCILAFIISTGLFAATAPELTPEEKLVAEQRRADAEEEKRVKAENKAVAAKAKEDAKIEAQAKAQAEAEAKAQAQAEAKVRAEAEARERVEAEAKARAEERVRLTISNDYWSFDEHYMSLTDLQKEEFWNSVRGKYVVWTGEVHNVKDNKIEFKMPYTIIGFHYAAESKHSVNYVWFWQVENNDFGN